MAADEALDRASVRELGRMLRAGETTSVELTRHALDRLDTIGRRLNAVVTLLPERALAAAQRADAELRAGVDRGPLHGIPYGVKDLIAVAGAPTTWGAAPLREQRLPYDATVVTHLDAAGAVLVAKLSMVELAGGMGYEQPNASLTGPGLSPWNPEAWSGGSSSGSGSAVGARAVPFAIGSETFGSIVTPSACCGVSGLRPTYGRVSRYGAMALCWTLDKLGPMCRTADDCGLVLDAIAGHDPHDPTSSMRPYRYIPEEERQSGFRLAALRSVVENAQPEVAANYTAALEALRTVATIEEVELPALPYGPVIAVILRAEAASAFDGFIDGGGIAGLTAPEDRLRPLANIVISARDYLRAQRIRARICRELDAFFARYDAIVAPTLPGVAPPNDRPFSQSLRRGGETFTLGAAGNLAGLPAISVPNGFGERGLPTAIQFVGRAYDENRVLAIANAYQRLTDWHTRVPPL
jgi:aspartyl-tRNA(Asn)/glutamyl-tRNA(Gln) amidotransferase subunit A